MSGLEEFARLVAGDHGLIVVSTLRADGTIQSSVVNAGVLQPSLHRAAGRRLRRPTAATRKLDNLRARPRATVVIRPAGMGRG